MTRYAGPSDPFPFLDHRTVAEIWACQGDASHCMARDPDPKTSRGRAELADRKFSRAIQTIGGRFA